MENLLYGKQIEEKHYDAQLLAKESTDRKIRKDVIIEYGIFLFYTKRSFK